MTPDRKRLLFLLFFSAAILMIGTRSSPLYPTNDWVDANAFLTMGKGLMNGQVPYRDLFEQKGPLLYFLHGLASLVSDRSFIGVYLLEVLSFTTWLWITWKTVVLWADGRRLSFTVMMLTLVPLAFITVNTSTFALGDSAEEFCLPAVATGIWLMSLRIMRERDPGASRGMAGAGGLLLGGVLAGCVMWTKFTLLGFWFGWMLAILIDLILRRRFREAVLSSLIFLSGMLAATLPWVVYFGWHKAIGDWLDVYLATNIKYYPMNFPLWFRPFVSIGLYAFHSFHNLPLFLLTVVGFVPLFRRRPGTGRTLRALVLCLGSQAFFGYIGGRAYAYYYLVFAPFAVLGCIAALPYLERLAGSMRFHNVRLSARRILSGKVLERTAAGLAVVVVLSLSYLYNPNARVMSVRAEDRVQYRFAQIIREDANPSLLNYGYMDYGFYLAAGLQPQVRYFENLNFPREVYPIIMDEQERYISERLIRFVVLRVDANAPAGTMVPAVLADCYELAASGIQAYRGHVYRYELYHVKDG